MPLLGGLGWYRLGHWKREIRGEVSWVVLSLLPRWTPQEPLQLLLQADHPHPWRCRLLPNDAKRNHKKARNDAGLGVFSCYSVSADARRRITPTQ